MKFSIIIPTYKNFNYLKLAIKSIKKNSKFNNEIIIHINGNDFKTEAYLKKKKIKYTKSSKNIGFLNGVNKEKYIFFEISSQYLSHLFFI